jgi:RNA recognition motif-containing protein
MSIKIYVGNLSFDSSEADLKGLFAAYGEVESAKIIVDQFTNRSRGFGFIEMANREEGLKAIQELDSSSLDGRSLKVNEARPKTDSRGGGGGGGGRGGGGRSRW